MRRSRSSHRSDYSSDSDVYIPPEDIDLDYGTDENNEIRHSQRFIRNSISYTQFDENDSSGSDGEDQLNPVFGNGRIDHIFFSRITLNAVEYLVKFQEASDIFAHWFESDLLGDQSSNFSRALQKFNETEMKMSSYNTQKQDFKPTYDSPIHIISHRPLNNDPTSNSLEFLEQFNLETGSPFVWEPNSNDAPKALIEDYMKNRVCVQNTHPNRPESLRIEYDDATKYTSRDGCVPRDYQIDGVNWMLSCFCSNHGCILADEMGLGKTIQCLTFLMHLNRTTDFHGPHLVAVRTNTYSQWCSEIERWSDLKYIAYGGARETRDVIKDYQIPYFDDKGEKVEGKYGFNILLVTYDIFLKDVEFFREIDWQIIMIDEGHRIKNNNGKKHNALISVPFMHRVILTGTPIQSTLHELWTLLNFVSPDYFVDSSMFPEDDVESLDEDVLNDLRRHITPHLMRRSLNDVEKSVIPKDEKIIFLQLTDAQKELTRLTKLRELWRIKKGGDDSLNEPNLLHRICNHPFLINGTENYYHEKYHLAKLPLLVKCSAKFIFLDRILPIFKQEGRSVLIFSQRIKILRLLSEYCQLKKYSHEILTGSQTETEKKKAIHRFSDKKNDVFIFLISTRSGSEGLNLTKASITIIFDPDWNPQNDLQAQGRCYRIGQTQKVDVFRLLTYGTYEHEMFARAQRKLKLWDTLLGEGKTTDPSLAEKFEAQINNDEESQQNFKVNLMSNAGHFDTIEAKGIITDDLVKVAKIKPEDSNTIEIPPPPVLQYPLKTRQPKKKSLKDLNSSFEEVLSQSSTVVKDIQLLAKQWRNFPTVDISFGLTDEQFLEKFKSVPGLKGNTEKKRTKIITQRVQLDPKTAKMIISSLGLHGYGKWEEINSSLDHLCPIEQISRFCQAATILHFRAIDPSKVAFFPLLLKQLQNDVPKFDMSYVMNNEITEWYTVFSKRSFLNGEANVCKLISNYIHKSALSLLARLENHLLIHAWCCEYDLIKTIPKHSDNAEEEEDNADFEENKSLSDEDKERAIANFPFQKLPLDYDRDIQLDKDLYITLIEGKPLNQDDATRSAQIINLMKSSLILKSSKYLDPYIVPFWTKGEVSVLLNLFRSFGEGLIRKSPKELKSLTALLSKEEESISTYSKLLMSFLSKRQPECHDPLILPVNIINSTSETISIDYEEVTATIKRILLNKFIRSALLNVNLGKPNLNAIVPGGQKWCTLKDCVLLLNKIVQYGMDSLVPLVLSPDLPFHQHLTPDDVQYLNTFNRSYIKEETKLPTFLINENKFYNFLKSISSQPHQRPQANPIQIHPNSSASSHSNPNQYKISSLPKNT